MEVINPFPPLTLSDLTRRTVDSFVAAQKALLEVMSKPAAKMAAEPHPAPKAKARPHKRSARHVVPVTA